MIPAEAIRVVEERLRMCTGSPGADWTAEARDILKAAAPHIQAAAWDEGEKAGYSNCVAVENGLDQSANPYGTAL